MTGLAIFVGIDVRRAGLSAAVRGGALAAGERDAAIHALGSVNLPIAVPFYS